MSSLIFQDLILQIAFRTNLLLLPIVSFAVALAPQLTHKLSRIWSSIILTCTGNKSLCSLGAFKFLVCSAELNQPVAVKTAAALFQQICYENKDRLLAGIIVAGWDPVEKGGAIYSIPLGGIEEEKKPHTRNNVTPVSGACVREAFAIGGSGSSYIYGYCDANYRPNMTREEAVQFVTTGTSSRVFPFKFSSYGLWQDSRTPWLATAAREAWCDWR